MIGQATPRQRLILAAAAAFLLDLALNFAGTRPLPAQLQTVTVHHNSFVQPMAWVGVAISLWVGGWIGRRRFLPLGVALVRLMQVLGLGLQLLAAALGAAAGAALHRRHPFPPLSAQESP